MKTLDFNKIIRGMIVLLFIFCSSILSFATNEASAAAVIYVNMGINGTSTQTQHLNWIVASSFTMGVSNAYSSTTRAANKSTLQPVTITKSYDMSSPTIAYDSAIGKVIKQVIIEIEQPEGDTIYTPIHIELDNVVITSVSSTLAEGTSTSLMEVVGLTYSKICWTYTPLKADGSLGTPVTSCYQLSSANAS